MKRASYRFGVAWIAENDEPGTPEGEQEVSELVSVLLIADLFGVDPIRVAKDVIRYRKKHIKLGA